MMRKSLAWSIFQSLYKTLLIAGISSVAGRLTASEALILKHASVSSIIILCYMHIVTMHIAI